MLPNLIIIGATNCGTSALHHYLGRHPEITMSGQKELRFFVEEGNWRRGPGWYEAQFEGRSTPVRGEASPQYTRYPGHLGVPDRMHAAVPDAKLIYLVRDPIERIVSSYVHHVSRGWEDGDLADALAGPGGNHDYLWQSSYGMQLEQYLRHYPIEQILVLTQEDLLKRRRATLRLVFRFLSVDEGFDSPEFDRIKNSARGRRRVAGQPRWMSRDPYPRPSGILPWSWRARAKGLLYRPFSSPIERPDIGAELRHELVRQLKPDTDQFRRLTGMRLENWSV